MIKTAVYNKTLHGKTIAGSELFSSEPAKGKDVTVRAAARGSTWTKVFDFNNEGLTEHNYQAYTYDFNVSNNTKDKVEEFSFKLTFDREVYLLSAWNGALEIHQDVKGSEIVDTVPDLREYVPGDHKLRSVNVDGESLIPMQKGDYLIYIPSTGMNAMEMPIEPFEGTTPGIILYVAIGQDIDGSVLHIDYMFHRLFRSEPLFWISLIGLVLWLISLIIFAITSAQIKKYREQQPCLQKQAHQRAYYKRAENK